MTDDLSPESRASATLERGDLEGLIPTFVATWADVDVTEHANIEAAAQWAFGRRRVATPAKLLTVEFADRVHRKMFDGVWRWAGHHRTTTHEHGVKPGSIAAAMMTILAAARKRHADGAGSPERRALQLHDALLAVRAYPGGNRRHARFMADLYLHLLDEPRLDWHLVQRIDRSGDETPSHGLTALEAALDQAMRPHRLQTSLDRVGERRGSGSGAQKRSPTKS
jgi:fido (protein-threonine AMPylation protein)